jgi:hypothetical protein
MRPTNPLFYVLAVALGLALYAPADALFAVIERRWPMEDHLEESFVAASSSMRAAMALGVILAGPMLEELLFRGALFRPMLKVYPASMVVSITGILFALAHIAPQVWIPVAILGAVLGVVRHASGSLVPGMLVHATFNAVPFYRMAAHHPGAPVSLDNPVGVPQTAPDAGAVPLWVVGVSAVAAGLLLALVRVVGASRAARLAQGYDLR